MKTASDSKLSLYSSHPFRGLFFAALQLRSILPFKALPSICKRCFPIPSEYSHSGIRRLFPPPPLLKKTSPAKKFANWKQDL